MRRRRRGTPARSCRRAGSTALATSGSAANQSRAASCASSSRSRTRRTAPKRSRFSMSETRPWARTWPAVDDRDAGAQLLELGQDVAADDDGLAHRAQLAEQLAQLDPGARVEARGRLVEQQHLRIVDQRVGQAQPLLHPAREGLDVRVALVAEVDQLEQVGDHPAPAGRRQPVAAGEEVEVLPDLHVVVDAEGVGHEAEDAPDLVGVPGDRPAGDLGRGRPRAGAASRASAAWSSCPRRSARPGRRSRPRRCSGRCRPRRPSGRSA